MSKEIILGLHFYQPPRNAIHPEIANITTDPQKRNWTSIIESECYRPLAEEKVLTKASFDIYQTLLVQLEKLDPQIAKIYQENLTTNGVGEAFLHPILPDLCSQDKQLVILAGLKRFKEITGQQPKYFWPPETAIDTDTLEVLSEYQYQGFICAPEQIIQNDGRASDSRPTLINLPSGRRIIALPFDRPISSRLAFDPKKNADFFTHNFITPRTHNLTSDQVALAWTDAETFGHHWPMGDKFLTYLLDNSLPQAGLNPISINDLKLNIGNLPEGRIVERSAWSCPHGNLIRWHGNCGCSWDGNSSWKSPFYETMKHLNDNITDIVQSEIGDGYLDLLTDHFHSHYQSHQTSHEASALINAKISSLVARTSCATFFSQPEVSAHINLLFAYQSLLYLNDAINNKILLKLTTDFYHDLSQTIFPGSNKSALTVLKELLN